MRIHDITQLIRPGIAVWPGDTPYSRVWNVKLTEGGMVDASAVTMSLHTGTHLDAPAHYLSGAPTVDQLDLGVLIGPAELVTLRPENGLIAESELAGILARRPTRLLVRANPSTDLSRFPEVFAAFSVAAARAIIQAGVRLLGTDAPSVDAFESDTLPVHSSLGGAGVVILENLRLADVPDGSYQLIALPLRIAGADGSPIRAVLLERD